MYDFQWYAFACVLRYKIHGYHGVHMYIHSTFYSYHRPPSDRSASCVSPVRNVVSVTETLLPACLRVTDVGCSLHGRKHLLWPPLLPSLDLPPAKSVLPQQRQAVSWGKTKVKVETANQILKSVESKTSTGREKIKWEECDMKHLGWKERDGKSE